MKLYCGVHLCGALSEGLILGICVCTYVHTWQSCLGVSICGHPQNVNLCSCSGTQVSLICVLHKDVNGGQSLEMRFLGNGGRGEQCGWIFTTYVFGGVECWNKCWTQVMAVDTEKKKAKKSVHRSSQESKKRTRKSSKEESMYNRSFVLFFGLPPLTSSAQFLTPAPCTPSACAMCIDTLAHGAARGIIHMHTPSNT